jgi:hypothetical protein
MGAASDPVQKKEKSKTLTGGIMKNQMIKRTVVTLSLFAVFACSAVAPGLAMSMGVRSYLIAPRETRTFTVTVYTGTRVRVGVSGDGSTDLDLYVYDSDGLVSKDDDSTDECRVNLVIYRSGQLTIKVVNRGRDYNEFNLWTN